MSTLAQIGVRVEASSGNLRPLLHEIHHALQRLSADGTPSSIDLRGVPLAPGEEERILEFLGSGELRAQIDTMGPSTVHESRFGGVWIVTHRDTAAEIMARSIEITYVPPILAACADDVREAAEQLGRELERDNTNNRVRHSEGESHGRDAGR